jgi:hypothetical protein
MNLFVRCGGRYEPPAQAETWTVIELPAELAAPDIPPAVERVRQALRGAKAARLLVAGPLALGIALGQALAHEPVAIEYLQLNQVTKEYEVWVTNRRNL